MKNNYRDIIFGSLLLLLFSMLIIWFISTGPQSPLPIVIAILSLTLGIFAFVRQTIKKARDIESGAPSEDEFTKLARVYAGHRAFLCSMYLWFLIFAFNTSFTKNETMLGIGILGSALIYGVSLWYYKATGEFNA